MADDKILYYPKGTPQDDRGRYVGQMLRRGESLTSVNEGIALEKFQNIHITQKPQNTDMSEDLSAEEKILRDFKETGKVIWHTYEKAEPLEEMDLDFKLVAAYHALKNANRINELISEHDEKWRQKMMDKMCTFMYVFEAIEEHLKEEHDITLPETVDEIRALRSELDENSKDN